MEIYGLKIRFPHSGLLTRSVVLTLLKKELINNYNGRMSEFDIKEECQKYNILFIEDINGEYRTELI